MAEKKIICDTDVMIDYWDTKNVRHVSTSATLKNIGLDNVILPAITKMELLLGATNKTDLNRINKEIARFNIALINDDITLKSFFINTKIFFKLRINPSRQYNCIYCYYYRLRYFYL